MLTQTYRREVPGTTAFVERTLLRDAHFCVAVVRSRSLAIDWGVLDRSVRHVARFRRPQLTIVLAGRGYLDFGGRVTSLRPGDVAMSDQSRHDGEGYGGAECEAIVVDWDVRGIFAGAHRGHVSRISKSDVDALRILVRSLAVTPAAEWVARLAARLRALGLPIARADARDIAAPPAQLARLYAALGPALSRLDQQPSLAEIAASVATSERQVHRLLAELASGYDHPFPGWRELVHEMRLGWATQILSLPDVPLDRVARLAGYRSTIALYHACSTRGAPTPRTIAARLAERWR